MEDMGAEGESDGIRERLWVTPVGNARIPRLTFDEPSRQNFWIELITHQNPVPSFSSENRLVDACEIIDEFFQGFHSVIYISTKEKSSQGVVVY